MYVERNVVQGNDACLREYQKRRYKKRVLKRIVLPTMTVGLLWLLLFFVLRYAFVVETVEIQGQTRYSVEELIDASGLSLGDNLLMVTEKAVEEALKAAFPYIESVSLEKEYPSLLRLTVTEENTTFYYESQGEFFLFNHELRLMDKFDSYEALALTRNAILVEMPEPKNYIVPQYIQMKDEDQYVKDVVKLLAASDLVVYVNEIDMRDRFVLRMNCAKNVTVELGDATNLEGKFSALYRLLGSDGSKMSGNVDLSCYPRCFYALSAEES